MVRTLGAFLIVCSVLSSASAAAQSGQGSLNGYVKDEQGGILPGATVTATGPSLLAPVVGVTDNAGYYRLQNLPPGLLTVTAELSGFATFRREGILMRAGSTFTVDIELKVGTLSETVTDPSPSSWNQTSPFGANATPTGPPATGMILRMRSVFVSMTTTRLSVRCG